MRRAKNEIGRDAAIEILNNAEWGVLSLSAEGIPYGVPINYVFAESENALYFHAAKAGKKLDVISKNAAAAFTVVGQAVVLPEKYSTSYKSVMLTGRVKVVADDAEKTSALLAICQRFVPTATDHEVKIRAWFKDVAVVKFEIDSITGKQNAR